jgi:hypothetical protein
MRRRRGASHSIKKKTNHDLTQHDPKSIVRGGSLLDAEPGFVRSNAPWFTIVDDLPQYWTHVTDGPLINRNE